MVTVDNHYQMSLYGCMFVALLILGKRQARPQMPKNSGCNSAIQPTRSPGALDESWGQAAHCLMKFTAPRQSQLFLAGAPPYPCCTLLGTLKDRARRTYPFWTFGHYHPNPRQTKRVNAHCPMREYLRTQMAGKEPVLQDVKTNGLPTDWSGCFQLRPCRAASPPHRTSSLIHQFQTGRVILSFSMQKSAKCTKRKEKKRQEKAQLLNIPVILYGHTAAPWRGATSKILTNITSAKDSIQKLGL